MSMTRKTRQSQRGISLLEILVAITLFAITSSGLAAFLVQTLRRTAGNRASTGAVIAAQHEVEDLRSLDYPAIVSRSYSTTITGKPYGVGTVVQNDTPASGMKQVTVTVSYTEPLGSESYVLRTILTQIH
jgi:prepilin-type N-terminal cleavage/methylation domain-containing protein